MAMRHPHTIPGLPHRYAGDQLSLDEARDVDRNARLLRLATLRGDRLAIATLAHDRRFRDIDYETDFTVTRIAPITESEKMAARG